MTKKTNVIASEYNERGGPNKKVTDYLLSLYDRDSRRIVERAGCSLINTNKFIVSDEPVALQNLKFILDLNPEKRLF